MSLRTRLEALAQRVAAEFKAQPTKIPVKAATTASITLSGLQTVDGVALSAGDRVLVRAQSGAATNGVYTVAAGAWARASDASAAEMFERGQVVVVLQGTTMSGIHHLATPAPIVLGSTALTYVRHTHVATTDLTATGTKNSTTFLRGDNTWAVPPNTTYSTMSQAEAESSTDTNARLATGQRLFQAISKWAVTLAGTQTVTGAKTFSIPPSIAALGNSAPATDAGNGSIWYDEDEPGVTTQTDAAALTTGTLGIARLPSSVVHRVAWTGSAWPSRPTGATYVEWVGPSPAPSGMTSADTFIDTSA